MDESMLENARRFQDRLEALDPRKDRDTLVWAHGFLSGVLERLEKDVPDLAEAVRRVQEDDGQAPGVVPWRRKCAAKGRSADPAGA